MNQSDINQFIQTYQSLNKDNLAQLTDIYHPDINFIDPLHQVEGLAALTGYFASLYENLVSCEFEIQAQLWQANQAALYWQMQYQHASLNGGKSVRVDGCSHLKFTDGLVIYHRDYLDAGAMLYEHIPLLGSAIRFIKKRASR
jgi:hypothetical protein